MKNQRPLGLLIEGNATSSLVLRLPSIPEDLGPIKASAPRVARRLSNFLGAGYPVGTFEELESAKLILMRVPDLVLPRVINELCASGLPLKNLSFVLCESCLSNDALELLQSRGAWTATLMQVHTQRKSWFVIEGQLTAIRQIRRLLQRNDARAFDLRPGTKSLYFAAVTLAGILPIPLLAGAQQALRTAGISGNHLNTLLEEMSLEMFRTFSNGVRYQQQWSRMGCSPEISDSYLERLRVEYPQIGAVLDAQLALAAEIMAGEKQSVVTHASTP
ncbi:MAG TPA: hypothetical protein VHZ55_12655 [Bryobacteraceae bacterium]|jgi:predicted short-subunit dehydrogenase-like oxidoreductase (DUF2520 family)|nr:hypothetical protein [Bryobacteraceae bacterium]